MRSRERVASKSAVLHEENKLKEKKQIGKMKFNVVAPCQIQCLYYLVH